MKDVSARGTRWAGPQRPGFRSVSATDLLSDARQDSLPNSVSSSLFVRELRLLAGSVCVVVFGVRGLNCSTFYYRCAVKMVQKYQSPVRVYKYPFELVMAVSNTGHFDFSAC